MTDTLANARIVTPDGVVAGSVAIQDGVIAAITDAGAPAGQDLNGDWLLPGLIDVHTDYLEKLVVPRAGVVWDSLAAVLAYDVALIGAGITTVFDSLVAGAAGRPWRAALLGPNLAALRQARAGGLLRADHALHIRCDLLDAAVEETVLPLLDEPATRFVTFMDDTPSRDPARSVRAHEKRRGLPSGSLSWPVEPLPGEAFEGAAARREALARACAARGIVCANHDDTKAAHVAEAQALGFPIAEFPLTEAAARAARAAGMATVAGAPNLVLGRSHGGSVSVRDLAAAGLLDVLCSDYVPGSLLPGIFQLHELGMNLHDAVATASATPARLFGYADRGCIAVGLRADLLRVTMHAGKPVLRQVWVGGTRVLGMP